MIFYMPRFHKMATALRTGANLLRRFVTKGMHLIIDGYGGDANMMWDTERLRTFLDEYPDNLGMTKITEPEVLEYHGPRPNDSGISGFVIIAESHISVHTFPHRDYVNIDVFSCKSFDHEQALADARALFGLSQVKTWVLDRGLEWLDADQGMTETRRQRSVLQAAGSRSPAG
jgi:S-adenosylmethionine decarboxylase